MSSATKEDIQKYMFLFGLSYKRRHELQRQVPDFATKIANFPYRELSKYILLEDDKRRYAKDDILLYHNTYAVNYNPAYAMHPFDLIDTPYTHYILLQPSECLRYYIDASLILTDGFNLVVPIANLTLSQKLQLVEMPVASQTRVIDHYSLYLLRLIACAEFNPNARKDYDKSVKSTLQSVIGSHLVTNLILIIFKYH